MRKCEFCGKYFEISHKSQRHCNRTCQRKKNYRKPEIRERVKKYNKAYCSDPANIKRLKEWRKKYNQKPEVKERNRTLAVTKYRKKRRAYDKEYRQRPEVKARINTRDRERRKTDKRYVIIDRLRRSFSHALTKYTKKGKIMKTGKYGLNWHIVLKGLIPFPQDLTKYEIDHIQPLHSFNLENPEEIKKAFAPSNLQWLTIEKNRIKGGKIPNLQGGNIKLLINA